jgi:pimeloyl-ACP methyl ester carboxylesterase
MSAQNHNFRSVQVGKRTLRYICLGSGTPTVIIDQGQGLSIERGFDRPTPLGWAKICKTISHSTQVVMHDRAGLGSSDPDVGPRTSADMVNDLRTTLRAAKVSPPYVLVGHSIGGFTVRLFAGGYPDEVAGVVLVDSCHPDQFTRFASIVPPETPDDSATLRILRNGPSAASTTEGIDFRACAEQVREVPTIGAKPLVVVSQSPQALAPPSIPLTVWEKQRIVWQELQTDLTNLSRRSVHLTAVSAGHMIQLEEPDLVSNAILRVVREHRGDERPLH